MPEPIQKPWRATEFHIHLNQEINMDTVAEAPLRQSC